MTNSYQSILIETPSQKGSEDHQKLAEICLEKIESPVKIKAIFLNTDGESFKISQARDLKSQAQYAKADNEPMAFVICYAEKITIPAQNALLKLLEEPPNNTILVLVASTDHQLLPTIKSRCKIEKISTKYSVLSTKYSKEVNELISFFQNPDSASYSDLIDISEKLKDREDAIGTLQTTLQQLHKYKTSTKYSVLSTSFILTTLDSLQKNGNVRLVLEDCFFTFKKTSK